MFRKPKISSISLAFIMFVSGCTNTPSTYRKVNVEIKNGFVLRKNIKTWTELNEQYIVKQKFDYSCGASALATLMTYYFNDDVTEKDVLKWVTKRLNNEKIKEIKQNGLSILDLEMFAKSRGYQPSSVKLKLSAIPKLKLIGPIIVYLEIGEDKFKHFSILQGSNGDRVFLADSSRGFIRKSIHDFSKEWTQGIALILKKNGFVAKKDHPLTIKMENSFKNELQEARKALYLM